MGKSFIFFVVLIVSAGCSSIKNPSSVLDKIIKTPSVYIETLKHPTEFPEEHLPEVLDVDEILKQNPLGEEEIVKILLLGKSKLASTHFVQVRKDGEIKQHFHKKHDKTISVKKGKGIAILNGTRYLIKPGTVVQVPGNTKYKFINTGNELFVALTVFTPPFDGGDITHLKEEITDRPASEAQKEKEKIEKKRKNKLIVKDKNSADKTIKSKNEKDKHIYNARGITKIFDDEKDFNNQQNIEKENKSENLVTPNSPIDELYTFDNDQNPEYDFDLDKVIDEGDLINRNTNNKEFTKDGWKILPDETDFDSDSEQYYFDEYQETKPNEFVYDTEEDLLDNRNKNKNQEVFEYAEDDPISDADGPFTREEIEEF